MMLLFQAINVINREIKRFGPFQRVPLPRSGGAIFDGLFQCDIGTGAFNHQSQIVFATNLLAARHLHLR